MRTRPAAVKHCTHYACRCARAAELAAMAERHDLPGSGRLLQDAIDVHDQTVRCRMRPEEQPR